MLSGSHIGDLFYIWVSTNPQARFRKRYIGYFAPLAEDQIVRRAGSTHCRTKVLAPGQQFVVALLPIVLELIIERILVSSRRY